MFKDTYKGYNENIAPSEKLIEDTIDKVGITKTRNITCVKKYKKGFVIAAVVMALVAVMAILPVFAVQIDSIYNIMYFFSPGFAQFYTPVNESSTSNNVKMDVLACYVHEDTIEIYLTMQDLTGERFSGGVDLYDSYSINTPYDCSSNCRLVSYDDDTKTAGFLITISQWNDMDISGDKVTFTVKEIITDKRIYSMNVPIDFSQVSIVENTQTVYINGGSLAKNEEYTNALVPTVPYEEFAVNGVELTGLGYIDGKLHIQYGVKNYLKCDNHGSFYLVDNTKSKPVNPEYSFYFIDSDNDINYCESVFDVSQEELEKYKIFCDFRTTGENISGNWKVTFPIENKGQYVPTEKDEIYLPHDVNLSDIATMNMGANVPWILYANDNRVIFEGGCGVIVYDLDEKEVVNRLPYDFLKSKGISLVNAHVSMRGDEVYISDAIDSFEGITQEEQVVYKYNIITGAFIKQKGLVEDVFPRQSFFDEANHEEMKKYMDNNKLTGDFYITREDDFVFLQGDTDWSMSSLQIVICDYDTGVKEIINVFE